MPNEIQTSRDKAIAESKRLEQELQNIENSFIDPFDFASIAEIEIDNDALPATLEDSNMARFKEIRSVALEEARDIVYSYAKLYFDREQLADKQVDSVIQSDIVLLHGMLSHVYSAEYIILKLRVEIDNETVGKVYLDILTKLERQTMEFYKGYKGFKESLGVGYMNLLKDLDIVEELRHKKFLRTEEVKSKAVKTKHKKEEPEKILNVRDLLTNLQSQTDNGE